MYARSDSMTVTLPQERFAFPSTATRSTEPEVFTFERVPSPATAVSSYVPVRPRRRAMRVMYPAKVRMHLPPPEKSQAKRWLVVLCLVVLWQIYTEEPCMDAPLSSAESSVSDYQSFPFQSAEQQAAQLPDFSAPSPGGCEESASPEQIIPSAACLKPTQETDTFEQSAGKSYVVALLVYHRLGNDN
ncbi:Radiation-inducible immediate-early gene IEX-1 [Oryzias melastigma]|uniref:Radiation-inducible immediate-early gene IEX-1 n=1 Tax=Oryzias melastigma TaxID=30732 RepID=A0A834BP63_ORYME|nr:Radiation-inducible immediate-early gene IEX-1 [Oryzias melastigma]